MNITLIGMPAAGKSRVGKELAKLTGMKFVDTDAEIEKRYGKIDKIFAEKGEGFFRERESEVIREISFSDETVISVGGGAVLREENMKAVKKNGFIVYLSVKPETVKTRTLRAKRPVISTAESVRQLYAKRAPIYEKYADLKIASDDYDLKRKTDAIMDFLNKYGDKK